MRPALACLKIVILETVNISASSFAVRARTDFFDVIGKG